MARTHRPVSSNQLASVSDIPRSRYSRAVAHLRSSSSLDTAKHALVSPWTYDGFLAERAIEPYHAENPDINSGNAALRVSLRTIQNKRGIDLSRGATTTSNVSPTLPQDRRNVRFQVEGLARVVLKGEPARPDSYADTIRRDDGHQAHNLPRWLDGLL